MSDNKDIRDGRDRAQVDANDSNEISFIQKKHGVTREQIEAAIKAVGSNREKIEEYLTKAR